MSVNVTSTASMETVLVVGSTGNIGVSAVIAALRSDHHVLAVVRNQASADKLLRHVGARQSITTIEADIRSDQGVKGIVDQVRAGNLPAFQHVYVAASGSYEITKLRDPTPNDMRRSMNINFESNFFAYQATIEYLLESANPRSTWTVCIGAQGDMGTHAAPAMTQGALYAMALAASRENTDTNVRFNEVYLAARVEVDSDAERSGAIKASEFASVYEGILSRSEIKGCRVSVYGRDDLIDLKSKQKVN